MEKKKSSTELTGKFALETREREREKKENNQNQRLKRGRFYLVKRVPACWTLNWTSVNLSPRKPNLAR